MGLFRWIAISLVFMALFCGYAFQQYSYYTGHLREWSSYVSVPNLFIGWAVVVLSIVFSIFRDRGNIES
jgi:hypothetical protein